MGKIHLGSGLSNCQGFLELRGLLRRKLFQLEVNLCQARPGTDHGRARPRLSLRFVCRFSLPSFWLGSATCSLIPDRKAIGVSLPVPFSRRHPEPLLPALPFPIWSGCFGLEAFGAAGFRLPALVVFARDAHRAMSKPVQLTSTIPPFSLCSLVSPWTGGWGLAVWGDGPTCRVLSPPLPPSSLKFVHQLLGPNLVPYHRRSLWMNLALWASLGWQIQELIARPRAKMALSQNGYSTFSGLWYCWYPEASSKNPRLCPDLAFAHGALGHLLGSAACSSPSIRAETGRLALSGPQEAHSECRALSYVTCRMGSWHAPPHTREGIGQLTWWHRMAGQGNPSILMPQCQDIGASRCLSLHMHFDHNMIICSSLESSANSATEASTILTNSTRLVLQ